MRDAGIIEEARIIEEAGIIKHGISIGEACHVLLSNTLMIVKIHQ